jgi:hypothetical protein
LITDIAAGDISEHQTRRLSAGAAPKSVNLEVATLRSILRRNRLWADIQPDVQMLGVSDNVGKALTVEEERLVLDACLTNRSKAILPVVTLALSTGMRYDEIRSRRWHGPSHSAQGRAAGGMRLWAAQTPDREPEHYCSRAPSTRP